MSDRLNSGLGYVILVVLCAQLSVAQAQMTLSTPFIENHLNRPLLLEPEIDLRNPSWKNAGLPKDRPTFNKSVSITDFGATPNDGKDDSQSIIDALNSEPDGTPLIVLIPEGSFDINQAISVPSNRIIRGAGPDKSAVLLSHTGLSFYSHTRQKFLWSKLTEGFEKGSTLLEMENIIAVKPGDFIEIVQKNDPDLMYTKPKWNQPWAARSVGQLLMVERVSGSTITITEPLNITFDKAMEPKIRSADMAQWIGFEGFKIDGEKAQTSNTKATIDLRNVAFSWLKDMESSWTDKQHFKGASLFHCEITNSNFHDSHNFGGNGHGYGVALVLRSTGCKVENNAFDTLRHSIIIGTGANGNVISYNYSQNPTWKWKTLPGDLSIHGHYSFNNLFEGNVLQKIAIADYWGPAGPYNLYFRNCIISGGLFLGEKSPKQILAGNLFQSSTNTKALLSAWNSTLINHGNKIGGKIYWDQSLSRNLATISSYYLDSKPYFLNEFAWPLIDVDVEDGRCEIPAQSLLQ